MHAIAPNIGFIDVDHQGRPHVIGACLLEGPDGVGLIDPGPASTLPTLLGALEARGIDPADVETVVATHIHLDHSGATGALVAMNPAIRVFVHERGAAHLIDPARLVKSARRLWPDTLDTLWGEPTPVPEERVTTLLGGETIDVAGHRLQVADMPGHASHHLGFFDAASGTAFAGDVAGVGVAGTGYVNPPTPPPDIDIEAWLASLDQLAGWGPARVVMTHFGAVEGVDAHLDQLRGRLAEWSGWAKALLDAGETGESGCAAFAAQVEAQVRQHLEGSDAGAVLQATPPDLSWWGLVRYWKQRA